MSTERELAPQYNPQEVEDRIYRIWEESGFFNPDQLPKRHRKPFTIIMPPPNANGSLHIGHAVFVTLQDIMIRFQRMRGRRALWVPGADHAGFETQVVFDKKLDKEGRNRFAIPREELFAEMRAFTETNKKIMENQLRRLGASCDWSRKKFTLDPDIVEQAQRTFVQLYNDGLIYRGTRVVNWCIKHQTALSELETKYQERKTPLVYLRYGPLTVATVRPETMFGDTAVAVHPKDSRYKGLIGKDIEVETLLGKKNLRVVGDEAVDPTFGTGAVKVTPAHDPLDYEIGVRHNLEALTVIGKNGRLNESTGPYQGMKVAEARAKVIEDLIAKGLVEKIEHDYIHSVAVCYKCENPLEPLVLPQWFLAMKTLAKPAIDAVKKNNIRFVPVRFKKVYLHWLENIRDWNLSQQISWGIRIPAWFCVGCGDIRMNPAIKGNWFFVRHGQTDWNKDRRIQGHSDIPLNDEGRTQAKNAAKILSGYSIDLVISSDLARAKETAEIIAKEIRTEIIFDKGFRERSYGDWEGRKGEDIIRTGDKSLEDWENPAFAPDGGENLLQLEERAHQTLSHHRASHLHKNVVIVTHGATLRSIFKRLKNLKINEIDSFPIHNASIFHFAVADDCKKCGSDLLEQDPDVLTTWFSSGQWPFLTLGYPKGKDYKKFYPTDVMETGWDILFFWVARMIMLGLYRTKKLPFHTIYLHGLVRDKDRQKMSKSKGNVIDPLGVAELYGTDAVRMALTIGNLPGNDIIISEEKIRGYRNFANKIWNASRFVLMHTTGKPAANMIRFGVRERQMHTRLRKVARETTRDMESLRFHHAADRLYHFFWHYYADVVIEEMKPWLAKEHGSRERETAVALMLEYHTTLMKLLHPFMPYVTEEIWSRLQTRQKNLLLIEKWPS